MLFDDYRGESGFSEMLKITDSYSINVECKGGSFKINPSVIAFTSNEPWRMWERWKGYDKTPFDNRVTDWFEFKKVGEEIHVNVLRGTFEDFGDPPDEEEGERLTDEQVEDILALPPTSRWLPKRKRPDQINL